MENLLNWQSFSTATTTREEVGKVWDLIGEGSKLYFVPSNFHNPDRNLMCVFKDHDKEESIAITCSPRVSKGIRNKEITKNNLYALSVYRQTDKNGEVFPQIQMPQGELIEVGEVTKGTEMETPVIAVEDLIAFE